MHSTGEEEAGAKLHRGECGTEVYTSSFSTWVVDPTVHKGLKKGSMTRAQEGINSNGSIIDIS